MENVLPTTMQVAKRFFEPLV